MNAFAHKDRIGWIGAGLLAILIMGFVEKFYFTLRHGLQTTYKSGIQRLAATLSYRAIQITMILNAAVLCAWIVGAPMPLLLESWNRLSILVHFMLALIGVNAVRDSDSVAAHRRLELKAETARQDLLTLRKAAMLGNPLVLFVAKLRGFLDGMRLARELLGDRSERCPTAPKRLPESTGTGSTAFPAGAGCICPASLKKTMRQAKQRTSWENARAGERRTGA